MRMTHTESYSPLSHSLSAPPTWGMQSSTITPRLHSQNAPRMCTGLNTRDISSPAEKAKSSRSMPPGKLVPDNDQPTPRCP